MVLGVPVFKQQKNNFHFDYLDDTQFPLKIGSALRRKNLLLGSKFFKSEPHFGREAKMKGQSCLPYKCRGK